MAVELSPCSPPYLSIGSLVWFLVTILGPGLRALGYVGWAGGNCCGQLDPSVVSSVDLKPVECCLIRNSNEKPCIAVCSVWHTYTYDATQVHVVHAVG